MLHQYTYDVVHRTHNLLHPALLKKWNRYVISFIALSRGSCIVSAKNDQKGTGTGRFTPIEAYSLLKIQHTNCLLIIILRMMRPIRHQSLIFPPRCRPTIRFLVLRASSTASSQNDSWETNRKHSPVKRFPKPNSQVVYNIKYCNQIGI